MEHYQLSMGVFDGIFAVPTAVVDRQLKLADAKALRTLLYLLRHSGRAVSPDELSKATGYSVEGVRDAIRFWADEGILVIREGDGVEPNLTPVESAAAPQPPTQPAPAIPAAAPVLPVTPAAPVTEQPVAGTTNARVISPRPTRLTAGEINTRCSENPELRFMLDETERMLARPLTPSDLSSFISLVDWAGLPVDLVLMLIGFCRDIGKVSTRYIEKVGLDWADKGIDTHEKAEEFIRSRTEQHTREQQVQTAFGISGRALTAKEKNYIDTWFGSYGFDIRMIRFAYERTIDQIGKMSFPYTHSILSAWHEKGYRDPKDASLEAPPASTAGARTGKATDKDSAASSLDLDFFDMQLMGENRK